jgi:hypothetical protein
VAWDKVLVSGYKQSVRLVLLLGIADLVGLRRLEVAVRVI